MEESVSKFRTLSLAVTAAMLGACSTVPPSPESALRSRASAYYDSLIKQEYRAVYGFFTPGYRAARSFEEHFMIAPPQGRYLEASVEDVRCVTDHACDVVINSRFEFAKSVQPVGGMIVPMDVTDRWVFVDGNWYLAPKR
ncbi:MAG TPA: hypothetical protein PLN31_05895 [Azoarcus taiwanensis]|nr:hypothetical protein [Azoarcus taiwanensis]